MTKQPIKSHSELRLEYTDLVVTFHWNYLPQPDA